MGRSVLLLVFVVVRLVRWAGPFVTAPFCAFVCVCLPVCVPFLPCRFMATGALANGATAAHLTWTNQLGKPCQKQKGRHIDAARGVCEGRPVLYAKVRWPRCDSCNHTSNKGHQTEGRKCGCGAPTAVIEQQVLVQKRCAQA